ncbi:MAG: oligosaccharide flippase family protein [Chitinivibrionales bacterium]|nr:oligosaccharide flippase family protein [Chitinivibrionales bacterium]MBD3394850.1 oligosaccharide flippase family protein [Chitinivibrionales bacterium]
MPVRQPLHARDTSCCGDGKGSGNNRRQRPHAPGAAADGGDRTRMNGNASSQNQQHGLVLIKNAAHCLFNSTMTAVIGWAISVWIARQLGVSNYGIFTLVLWLSGIGSSAIGMGFSHAVTKFVAEHRGRQEHEVVGPIVLFVLKIEILLSAGTTLVLVFFATPIADFWFSPSESFYFFLAFLGILPGIVTAILSATIEGLQKFQYFTYANLIITPFSLASKVAVVLMGKGIGGLLTVMLVFSFINTLFYAIVLKKEGIWTAHGPDAGVRKALKRRIHKYNMSVMAIIVCNKIIWDKSENFFLGRFWTATEVGFYNLGFNIVWQFSRFLPNTFWRVLFPAMSHYAGAGDHHKTRRVFFLTTRYLAFMSFPIGVGGAILAYPMIHFLYGHSFIGAQRPLQIMFLASIVTMICNPGAAVLYGYDRQAFIYKLGFVMAVVNVILDIILIKPFGAVGAALCFSLTTVVGSTIGTIYTCRVMDLRFPIISLVKILFATIIMGIAMELIVLQNYKLLGFVLAVLVGGFVYLVSALALGTFEEEDYTLLQSIDRILPGKSKRIIHWLVKFVSSVKTQNGGV